MYCHQGTCTIQSSLIVILDYRLKLDFMENFRNGLNVNNVNECESIVDDEIEHCKDNVLGPHRHEIVA